MSVIRILHKHASGISLAWVFQTRDTLAGNLSSVGTLTADLIAISRFGRSRTFQAHKT